MQVLERNCCLGQGCNHFGIVDHLYPFVAIHGYLNPLNWKISVYGIIMIGFIAALGYLFKTAGIIAAITAHSVFDAILLFQLVEKNH